MARKLSLLKPDKKTVYLESGKGQEVNYLQISTDLNLKSLQSDVKLGAAQYKECLEFAEKKPSRVVLIDCVNEEEGLMAASYLAGVYNWKDDAYKDILSSPFAVLDDGIPNNASEEIEETTIEDYDEMERCNGYGDAFPDFDSPTDEYETSFWEESPCKLPVIKFAELVMYSNRMENSIYSEGPVFTNGVQNANNVKPYWLTARREPVCIVADMKWGFGMYGFGGFGFGGNETNLVKELRRFSENRHVYVVLVGEKNTENSNNTFLGMSDEDDFSEVDGMDLRQEVICEMILEHTAGTVKIGASEDAYKKYYQTLFENWAMSFGVKLEKRFPKQEIAMQIVSMRYENKSEQMEKVFRYVLSTEREGEVLTKKDFEILKRFRVLGIEKNEEKKKADTKLDTMLVGMDNVKKQVRSIVEVMKYNKRREQMGLGKSGYHNVHLLIGAPGTAKTTTAQLLGNMMCEERLLPGNRFISINGADLKGMYVGHSAPKTKRYFDEYDIILIDEAYSLTSEKEMDSFSQEALAQLIIELEKHGMDKLVMFAGYGGKHVSDRDNKMKQFLEANPGIRSRINSTIYFDSYTAEEMVEIVHCQAKNRNYNLTHEGDNLMKAYFEERAKAADFGNGREARSFLENLTTYAAHRTMKVAPDKITKKLLQELTVSDIEETITQMREAYCMQMGQERRKCGFMKGEY